MYLSETDFYVLQDFYSLDKLSHIRSKSSLFLYEYGPFNGGCSMLLDFQTFHRSPYRSIFQSGSQTGASEVKVEFQMYVSNVYIQVIRLFLH